MIGYHEVILFVIEMRNEATELVVALFMHHSLSPPALTPFREATHGKLKALHLPKPSIPVSCQHYPYQFHVATGLSITLQWHSSSTSQGNPGWSRIGLSRTSDSV